MDDAVAERTFAEQNGFPTKRPPCLPKRWRLDAVSLGLKRNFACQLARGVVIAHFDDDDLYCSKYLEVMYQYLAAHVRQEHGEDGVQKFVQGDIPAIATLTEWHLVHMMTGTFRYLNTKTQVLTKEEWRSKMMYGFGFSYIFTRAAWQLEAFPDTETEEDDVFMDRLMKVHGIVPALVSPQSGECKAGLVAHTYHPDCTSEGVSETDEEGRWMGQVVDETPTNFKYLMVTFQQTKLTLQDCAERHPGNKKSVDKCLNCGVTF
jgi:hypothetical protein